MTLKMDGKVYLMYKTSEFKRDLYTLHKSKLLGGGSTTRCLTGNKTGRNSAIQRWNGKSL